MSNLFIPEYAKRSGALQIAQRRILLCSEPGEGKTFTTITTSPNPIVADIDRGITDPRLVQLDIPILPFWDLDWNFEKFKKKNICLALMEFLRTDAKKLSKDQTLIIDSQSSLEDETQKYQWAITKPAKTPGELDVFDFWDKMKDYWIEFYTQLSYVQCHVILTAHLAPITNKDHPNVIEGLRPMLDGSMKNKFGRFFTDIIRQHATSKKTGETITTEYRWQVKADSMFKAKSRADINTLFMPASFKTLINLPYSPITVD